PDWVGPEVPSQPPRDRVVSPSALASRPPCPAPQANAIRQDNSLTTCGGRCRVIDLGTSLGTGIMGGSVDGPSSPLVLRAGPRARRTLLLPGRLPLPGRPGAV